MTQNERADIRLGNTEVLAVYLGESLVWAPSQEPIEPEFNIIATNFVTVHTASLTATVGNLEEVPE